MCHQQGKQRCGYAKREAAPKEIGGSSIRHAQNTKAGAKIPGPHPYTDCRGEGEKSEAYSREQNEKSA
jgi:hypothetical protein